MNLPGRDHSMAYASIPSTLHERDHPTFFHGVFTSMLVYQVHWANPTAAMQPLGQSQHTLKQVVNCNGSCYCCAQRASRPHGWLSALLSCADLYGLLLPVQDKAWWMMATALGPVGRLKGSPETGGWQRRGHRHCAIAGQRAMSFHASSGALQHSVAKA